MPDTWPSPGLALLAAPIAYFIGVLGFVVWMRLFVWVSSRAEVMGPRQSQAFAAKRWGLGARIRGLLVEAAAQALSFALQGAHTLRLLPAVAPHARGTPVVLLHGFVENQGNMWVLARRLHRRGYRVFSLTLPSTLRRIEKNVDFLGRELERIRGETGEARVALIGHSMGGLISRRYVHAQAGHGVSVVITVASPHDGTHTASLTPAPSTIQMRRGGSHARAVPPSAPDPVPVHCMVAAQEDIVAPPWSALLEGNHVGGGEHLVLDEPVGHAAPLFLDSALPHFERWLLAAGVERSAEALLEAA